MIKYNDKIGDMYYPIDLKLKWYERIRWGVVTELHEDNKGNLKGHWKSLKMFYCRDCANLYSRLLKEGVIKATKGKETKK